MEEFQKHIRNLFLQDELIANISDDILVGGRTEEEHDANLRKCLTILQENNLTLNEEKCIWKVPEVTFFGVNVSGQGIKPTNNKVEAITAVAPPTSTKEVSSFLGMVTYLTRFIPDLSTETTPLRRLLQKDNIWKWGEEQDEGFRRLKELVCSSKVLAHFNSELETSLITDAGKTGLGAILVQTQKDGTLRPVAFASRTLTKQEVKYSQTEKEALAVVYNKDFFFNNNKDFLL